MKVWIPQPLLSYTDRQTQVEASGGTLSELLCDLDRLYPGIRFRMIDEQDDIRPHIRIFVDREQVRSLEASLSAAEEVHILQALSGG